MIEACFKAFARALRVAVAVDPAETGDPVDQGDADVSTVAIVDYGMGNRRSVEKALEHVGATVARHRRPRGDPRRRRGRRCPAWARSRRRCAALQARRPRRGARRERADGGAPVLGICLGMQLLFERSTEHEGAQGLGLLPGDGDARSRRRSCPHIGWNLVTFAARIGADRRTRRRGGLLPRALASSAGPPTSRRGRRAASTASASPRSSSAATSIGVQFHPEKSSPRRPPAAAQLRRALRAALILYPAIDILDGKAVRLVEGRFEDATVYHDDPLDGRASRGSTRARASCTSSTSTAPAPASRARSSTCAGSSHETGVPVQYGGGLRTVAGGPRGAAGRRRARDRRHRRVPRRRLPRRRSSPPSARASSSRSTSAAATISTAGWTADDRRCPPTTRSSRLGDRGVRVVRLHRRRPRRQARGPGPRRRPRGRRRRARALPLLRRDRRRSSDLRALAALRQVNLAGVIVGKALYERRFTVAEGQAALDSARPADGYSRPRIARHRR